MCSWVFKCGIMLSIMHSFWFSKYSSCCTHRYPRTFLILRIGNSV
nr:MAG TPA: hypothetical protein [Caudoviricetes sp.]